MPFDETRVVLASGLHARRTEIEEAATERVFGVADIPESVDPEYVRGLRTAISTTIEYAVLAIERGELDEEVPFPGPLLLQARRAARNGINIDAVLRRYMGGFNLFADILTQEAERNGIEVFEVQQLVRRLGRLFDRLLAAIAAEYEREAEARVATAEVRRTEKLQRLIDGDHLDVAEFGYDFEGVHLGVVASGTEALEALRRLATGLDRRLLSAPQGDDVVWAWLGGRRELAPREVWDALSSDWPAGLALALGEAHHGLIGWRLTHRQAKAAFEIAHQGRGEPVYYADVALLVSTLNDDLLVTSLRKLFLEPLQQERDHGEAARDTLKAYFAAGRNASSAAALLGVSRRTVTNRLRAIEMRFGHPLSSIGAEVEIALRLDELDGWRSRVKAG